MPRRAPYKRAGYGHASLCLAVVVMVVSVLVGAGGSTAPAFAQGASCTFTPSGGGSGGGAGPTSVTGAVAGATSIAISCTGLTPSTDTFIAVEASPLGAVVVAPGNQEFEADLATLGALSSSGNATLVLPSPFKALNDPNATCPPSQAQLNAGLVGCLIAVADETTASEVPGAVLQVLYQAQGTPADPTLALGSSTASVGDTVSVSGSGWWGGGPVATAIPIPATDVTVGGITAATANLTVSPARYDGTTLTPPAIGGTLVVPTGVPPGNATVAIDEPNSTPVPGNGPGNTVEGTAIIGVQSGLGPLQVSTTALPGGTVGAAYSAQLQATGGTPPYTWSIGGQLPAGLSLDSATGAITGTPSAAGTASFSAQVKDASSPAQSATATELIAVSPATSTLRVSTTALPGGTVGAPYSAQLQATGGTPPYTWSIGGQLPAGLSLDSATGAITGTPSAAGTASFSAQVKDASSPAQSATATESIAVSPATSSGPVVSTVAPGTGASGTRVVILGTGFLGDPGKAASTPTVRFGNKKARRVACVSDTACLANAPPRTAGPVDVTISVNGVTSAAAPGASFTYVPFPKPAHYLVYWDQNEEEDLLSSPSGAIGQLVAPYDPNGQMCIFPDHSGRFVTGYNPTLASQDNPGSLKPVMQPPVGEAVWSRHGSFTGKTIFVPGPYMLPGQTVGGDIPPDPNTETFNDNGTFTGCVFDHHANLFAVDLGTAQGQFPPPTSGRLIEWFAPSYNSYCVVDGPTTGGVGPHHVEGTGGLSQPGDLAVDAEGNVLVPEADPNGGFNGEVLKVDHRSLPANAAACGSDGVYPPSMLRTSVFIQGSLSLMPFPQAIAHDPVCNCWGVATTIGDPAIAWFDNQGHQLSGMGVVPGEGITQVGANPDGYNPFGLTFAADGTAYFVDIHIVCSAPLTNCGPANNGGRIMWLTFTHGHPNAPVPVATGYNFPTSITTCTLPDGALSLGHSASQRGPDALVCPTARHLGKSPGGSGSGGGSSKG